MLPRASIRMRRNDRVGPSTTKIAAGASVRSTNAFASRIGSISTGMTDGVVLSTLSAANIVVPQSTVPTSAVATIAAATFSAVTPLMREATAIRATKAAAPSTGNASAVPKKRISGIGRSCA